MAIERVQSTVRLLVLYVAQFASCRPYLGMSRRALHQLLLFLEHKSDLRWQPRKGRFFEVAGGGGERAKTIQLRAVAVTELHALEKLR
jgi:hypothetical protein